MKKKILGMINLFMVFSFVAGQTAFADEAQLIDMVQNMQKQMTDLQSTVAMQKAEIQALKTKGPGITMAAGGVEAPAMSEEDFAKQFNKNLKGKIGESDKWLKDLKFKGDLRLRYEAFNGTSNETDARNRFRYRLRFGFDKKFSDEWNAGFALASGEYPTASTAAVGSAAVASDPTSTNTSFDNDFSWKPIYIEKAYGSYTPNWAKIGPIEKFNITAGKMDNPFEKGSSDIVWDRDVKPEGITEKVDLKLFKTDNLNMKAYVLGGQFVLDEESNVTGAGDANLFAIQMGLNPELYTSMSEKPIKLLSAVSYYNFGDYTRDGNFTIGGVSLARGNPLVPGSTTALAAGAFNLWEVYNEVSFNVMGKKVAPYFDWVSNIGNSANDYAVVGNNNSNAYALGIAVGETKKKGDWMGSYAYKWIGANATPGFNDSDFGNTGHSGKAGSVFKAGYSLTDYLTLNGAMFFVNNLNQSTAGTRDEHQNRFQMDMTWKF
jgi:hypothetical protein